MLCCAAVGHGGVGTMSARRDLNMRQAPARWAGQILPAVLFGTILVLGLGGIGAAAGEAAVALDTPRVGDIATFRAQPGQDAETAPVIPAVRAGQGGTACVLDAAAMGAAQGSLL